MRHSIALIHKDPESDCGVSFPDFPGCITIGSDLDEAYARAEKVLAFHVEGLMEDGDGIPEPGRLGRVMAGQDNRDGVAILVPSLTSGTPTRVGVALPADMLDRLAAERGIERGMEGSHGNELYWFRAVTLVERPRSGGTCFRGDPDGSSFSTRAARKATDVEVPPPPERPHVAARLPSAYIPAIPHMTAGPAGPRPSSGFTARRSGATPASRRSGPGETSP